MSDTPKRGWLSFSIRDIMLATVIAAILVSWWLDHRYLADDAQVTREQKARNRDFERKLKSGFYDRPNSAPGAPPGGVSGSLKK
jgi:hypothetical protein